MNCCVARILYIDFARLHSIGSYLRAWPSNIACDCGLLMIRCLASTDVWVSLMVRDLTVISNCLLDSWLHRSCFSVPASEVLFWSFSSDRHVCI